MEQVDREQFIEALCELGHDPKEFSGLEVSVSEAAKIYRVDESFIIEAVQSNRIRASANASREVNVNILDLAYHYYCYVTSPLRNYPEKDGRRKPSNASSDS